MLLTVTRPPSLARQVRNYAPKEGALWGATHCFGNAMLSMAHHHGAELVFRRASPSRAPSSRASARDAELRRK